MLILALGGAVTAGVGYLGWQALRPAEPSAVVAKAPAAASTEAVAAAPDPGQPELAPDPTKIAMPEIDTWRVAPDGEALVAGRAIPGAKVQIVVDEVAVAEGKALASGEFVLQFTLPPNPAPSLLWLSMTPPDGTAIASAEMVALAPIAGPKLALAAPDPVVDPAAAAEDATAPAALLVTEEGAVVLQDAAPADPALAAQVMIDTISYAPTGAVQVGGRGAGGASLRLYLDNAEVASVSVPPGGRWLVTLGDTLPGLYTLRVDQIDASGKVSSRFETPFQRETLDALAEVAAPESAPGSAPKTAPEAASRVAAPEPAVPETAPELAADVAPETAPDSPPDPVGETTPAAVTITVQPGFTLWGIAQERLGDGVLYVQVFEANRDTIKDPDLIYPGQVVSIPVASTP